MLIISNCFHFGQSCYCYFFKVQLPSFRLVFITTCSSCFCCYLISKVIKIKSYEMDC